MAGLQAQIAAKQAVSQAARADKAAFGAAARDQLAAERLKVSPPSPGEAPCNTVAQIPGRLTTTDSRLTTIYHV